MAQSSMTTRDSAADVTQFVEITARLVVAAGLYAEGGEYDKEADAMMRKIRVSAASLNAALSAVNIMPPPVVLPPPTPEAIAAMQQAAAAVQPAPAAAPSGSGRRT